MIDVAKIADLVSPAVQQTGSELPPPPPSSKHPPLPTHPPPTTPRTHTLQVLLLVDASFGFEMETFEFLNVLQVHGFPRVMGVLTHLDLLRTTRTQRRTKKSLKQRFWTEIYQVPDRGAVGQLRGDVLYAKIFSCFICRVQSCFTCQG